VLQEAHRVLKPGGWLWICEVRSRFTGQSAGDSSSTQNGSAAAEGHISNGDGSGSGTKGGEWVKLAFTRALQKLGFKVASSRVLNKMFVVFELRKGKGPAAAQADVQWPELKASVYKKQ
jgi:ubiquinone/menaquinone biosynthesis C-methylase UbiE